MNQENSRGIIFYTDNEIFEPIKSTVMRLIGEADLPIVSCSLKPLDFGKNIVLNEKRGYIAMIKQIITALENLDTRYVFFCEHDVLYNDSHFQFVPSRDDIFYYNRNNYRWEFGADKVIQHDRMLPLSVMCCNRELALKFYKYRWEKMQEIGLLEFHNSQSSWIRKIGFEPGTKKKKRGGLTDDDFDTWESKVPVIDIRHKGTFSPPKCTLDSFKHAPINWREISIDKIPYWNLKSLFNL